VYAEKRQEELITRSDLLQKKVEEYIKKFGKADRELFEVSLQNVSTVKQREREEKRREERRRERI
jgi:hypothetical protein